MSELVDCINSLSAKDIIKSIAKTANGTPFYLQTVGAGGFSAEYQAVYDSFVTPPDAAIAAEQDIMVRALVAAGLWAKMDLFYLCAQNNGVNALLNWLNPGTFDGTLANKLSVDPSFTAFEGFYNTGNGYIMTGYNSSTDAINVSQNDCATYLGTYQDIQDDGFMSGSSIGVNFSHGAIPRRTNNLAYGYLNSNVEASVLGSTGKQHFGFRRSGANDMRWAINKVFEDETGASGVPNNLELYLLCQNDGAVATGFSSNTLMYFIIIQNISDADSDILQDAMEAYLDSQGKGLLP